MILFTLFPELQVSLLFAYSQISEARVLRVLQNVFRSYCFILSLFIALFFSSAIRLKDT